MLKDLELKQLRNLKLAPKPPSQPPSGDRGRGDGPPAPEEPSLLTGLAVVGFLALIGGFAINSPSPADRSPSPPVGPDHRTIPLEAEGLEKVVDDLGANAGEEFTDAPKTYATEPVVGILVREQLKASAQKASAKPGVSFELLSGKLKVDTIYNNQHVELKGGEINIYAASGAISGAIIVCRSTSKESEYKSCVKRAFAAALRALIGGQAAFKAEPQSPTLMPQPAPARRSN